MAALRIVLADHILTMPQRFLENTHKHDLIYLFFFGGSGCVFFSLFFRKEKNPPHQAAMPFFFLTPCSRPVPPASQKGDLQILRFSLISETGYFYSFLTSIHSQTTTLRHVDFC